MTSDCRLCLSPCSTLTKTIDDPILVLFLDLVPSIELSDNPLLSTSVCQLCYGKAKICNDFVGKINDSQENLKTRMRKRNFASVTLASPADIIKKMQQNSGISIKKVKGEKSVPDPQEIVICSDDDEPDNLLEEIEVSQSRYNDDEEDDDYVVDDDDDSDEDFKPNNSGVAKNKAKSAPNPKNNNSFKKEGIFIDAPVNFTCAKCKESFSTFDLLAVHMKARTCFIEKIACKECGKEFKSKKNLYSHTQIHKKKEKVMCESCAKEFNTQFDLDTHMEAVHRRVVKKDCIYRCTNCNDTFESHLDLLDHVKKHNQEKKDAPRLCEICAKVCPNLKSYQSHISNHRDKKSFVCEVCSKAFSKGFQLTQHMHVHTGIKAFSCDICQRSYAKRESLRVHKKKEHPSV